MNQQSFQSLDEILGQIRADCEAQLKAMEDKLLACQIESTMAKDQLKIAREAQMAAERVATKLLTQFGLVSKVFEEAREMALALEPPPVNPVERAKNAIDAALNEEPLNGNP